MTIYGGGKGAWYRCPFCEYEWSSRTKYRDPKKCPYCHKLLGETTDERCELFYEEPSIEDDLERSYFKTRNKIERILEGYEKPNYFESTDEPRITFSKEDLQNARNEAILASKNYDQLKREIWKKRTNQIKIVLLKALDGFLFLIEKSYLIIKFLVNRFIRFIKNTIKSEM